MVEDPFSVACREVADEHSRHRIARDVALIDRGVARAPLEIFEHWTAFSPGARDYRCFFIHPLSFQVARGDVPRPPPSHYRSKSECQSTRAVCAALRGRL